MTSRLRRMTGAAGLLVFVFFYIWIMTDIGAIVLTNGSGVVKFVYFVLAGLGWVIPAGAIIWWMYRPLRKS